MSDTRLWQIAAEWEAIAGAEEFAVELAEVFASASQHLSHVDGSQHVVELCTKDTGEARALLELVDSPRRAMTKLLKIWTSPTYWGAADTQESVEAIADVFAGAFLGMIQAGENKGYEDVKIYGRSNAMLEILVYLAGHWEISATSATMEGRWLRISLNERG